MISYYPEFESYYPDCEPETKKWFVDNIKKDWIVFDCGANIGYFTILFSRLASQGKVYAFEPTSTYNMLLQNLVHNKSTNVIAIKKALGNKTGEYTDSVFRI
jgi:predicted methyltransferase